MKFWTRGRINYPQAASVDEADDGCGRCGYLINLTETGIDAAGYGPVRSGSTQSNMDD